MLAFLAGDGKETDVEAEMVLIVHRHSPFDGIVRGDLAGPIPFAEDDIGHALVSLVAPSVRVDRDRAGAPRGLLRLEPRDLPILPLSVIAARPAVDEVRVGGIVLEVVEYIAMPHVDLVLDHTLALEVRISRERRRLPLALVDEDQAEILDRRVAPDLDALAERLGLGRLLHALAIGSIDPAVVEAA